MTSFYLNGGSPTYSGVPFTSTTELLDIIKNTLVNEVSWTEESYANGILQLSCTDNGHTAYFKLSVETNNSLLGTYWLNIQGDYDGTNTDLSPKLQILYNPSGTTNRLWISCNSSSACIAIYTDESDTPYMRGVHLGFLEREDPDNDATAVMVGYIDNSLSNAYVKASYVGDIKWSRILDHTFYNNEFNSLNQGAYAGVTDRFTTIMSNNTTLKSNNRYPSYNAQNGNVNGVTGLPVFGTYYYIEGNPTNVSNYISIDDLAPELYFRGYVQNCAVGVCSLLAGYISQGKLMECETGEPKHYLSVGDIGWQAMRIS